VKTPLPVFGLLAVAAVVLRNRPRAIPVDLLVLIVIPLALLAFVSMQISMNKHVRYVLPMLPYLAILAGASGRVWLAQPRWPRVLACAFLGWMVLAGLVAARDPLAYFNELAGGPRGGGRNLAGSNLDWGQGMYRLRDWLDAHPEFQPVALAYYGHERPPGKGLKLPRPPVGPPPGRLPPDPEEQRKLGPQPGRYAISVRILQGDAGGDFVYFQHFQPVATAGDSIWLFDIPLEDANRVRKQLGLIPLQQP